MAKVARDTLSDLVAKGIVAHVRDRRLRPGDALPPETRLAERFGVSRPVIREALQILRGRGLIDAHHHRTATVAPASGVPLADFVEHHLLFEPRGPLMLLEFRRGVEVESARLAAARAETNELRRMRATVDHMAELLYDLPRYVDADIALHDQIATASRNPLIAHFLSAVRTSARDTIELGLRSRMSDEELRTVQHTHVSLVDALEARDPDAAGRAMAYQFDDALRAIRVQLDEGEHPATGDAGTSTQSDPVDPVPQEGDIDTRS